MTELGKVIARAREEMGWSQAELARKAKVAQGSLSLIEAGTTKQPKPQTLDKIADALGLSAYRLKELAGIIDSDLDFVLQREGQFVVGVEVKRQNRTQQLLNVYNRLPEEDQARLLEMIAMLPQLDERNQNTLLAMARTLLHQQQAA
jgi:transcriptional regulator with XRE-family HTH domain